MQIAEERFMPLRTDNFEISYYLHIQRRYSKPENQNISVCKSTDNNWINSLYCLKLEGYQKI